MIAVRLESETDFAGWRSTARALALNDVPADRVLWQVNGATEADLFGGGDEVPAVPRGAELAVPKEFVGRAETVILHRDAERFSFLYRMLLRIAGDRNLLARQADPDVRRFETMEKAIRRDVHKMRAFVRFRKVGDGAFERYVAWFEPDHHIVECNAEFFVSRFTGMNWTILTPDRSASWDGARLAFGPGASKSDLPDRDNAEDLWKAYFASIFNPARLKVKAMTAEMPKKYWKNMPETALIPDLIANSGRAAQAMIERAPTLPPASHHAVQSRYWGKEKERGAEETASPATEPAGPRRK